MKNYEIKCKINKLPELQKHLIFFSKLKVDVGIFGAYKQNNEKNKNDLTLVTVAKINEYGSVCGRIPPRPFIRGTLRKHAQFKKKFRDTLVNGLQTRLKFLSYFSRFGIHVRDKIQKEFSIGEFLENSQVTIKKKNSSRPLVDSGQLRRSLSFRILK